MYVVQADWYDFPDLYDIAFGWDTGPEIAFLEDLFGRLAPAPVRGIYEPFCGSGRLAIPLAQRGYSVIGVDANPRMLVRAAGRAVDAGVNPTFEDGDAAKWRCEPPVDAVVTLIDSFRHLTTPAAAAGAVTAFRASLRPGGLLVIGLTVGDRRTEPNTWTMEHDGRRVQTSVNDTGEPGDTPGTTLMHCRFDVVEPDGRRHAVECRQPMRRYRLPHLVELLSDGGRFAVLETWTWRGPSTRVTDLDPSDSVVVVARAAGD